jgi:repressor LexA
VPGVPDVLEEDTRQKRAELRREEIWEFIADFTAEHGYNPTIRQIAEGLGIASIGNVHHHLRVLARRGVLLNTQRGYIIPRGVTRPVAE